MEIYHLCFLDGAPLTTPTTRPRSSSIGEPTITPVRLTSPSLIIFSLLKTTTPISWTRNQNQSTTNRNSLLIRLRSKNISKLNLNNWKWMFTRANNSEKYVASKVLIGNDNTYSWNGSIIMLAPIMLREWMQNCRTHRYRKHDELKMRRRRK